MQRVVQIMTAKDKETIQRALGKIEAVAIFIDDKYGSQLFDAIETIDYILGNREEGEDDA